MDVTNDDILRASENQPLEPSAFVKRSILVKFAVGLRDGTAEEWAHGVWETFRKAYVAANGYHNLPENNKTVRCMSRPKIHDLFQK